MAIRDALQAAHGRAAALEAENRRLAAEVSRGPGQKRVGVGVVALSALLGVLCGGAIARSAVPESAPSGGAQIEEPRVSVKEIRVGTGPRAGVGDRITIRARPIGPGSAAALTHTVRLGQNEVIQGFEIGLFDMQPHGVRQLVVPPALASRLGEAHPPYVDTFTFEVEVLELSR